MRDFLGFSRNVIVQATCHGADNRALVDALKASNGLARGIATVKASVGDAELKALDEAGVRGVRFNFVKRLVDATPRETYLSIAERIAKLGWHIVVYFEAHELADLIPFLEALPTTIVVDHMGRPDLAKGLDHPDFRRFVDLMARQPAHLEQGQRRRAPVDLRPAELRRLRSVRAARSSRPFPTACCGAPIGRTPT